MMNNLDNMTPKKIGNFNIPKNVIECKIDTLAFLEILLRKNICTWEEVEEVREAVVMHLNVIFPELQLSYTTPQPLRDQAPITPPEQPQKPLYYTANPTDIENVSNPNNETKTENTSQQQSTQQNRPLFHTAAPKVMGGSANVKQGVSPIRPINQNPPSANSAPKAPENNNPTAEGSPEVQNENPENIESVPENQGVENTNPTPPNNQQVNPTNNQTQQQVNPANNQTQQQVNPANNQTQQQVNPTNNQTQQQVNPTNNQAQQQVNPANNQAQQQVKPTQKPPFPTSGPPRILNNPPRRKI